MTCRGSFISFAAFILVACNGDTSDLFETSGSSGSGATTGDLMSSGSTGGAPSTTTGMGGAPMMTTTDVGSTGATMTSAVSSGATMDTSSASSSSGMTQITVTCGDTPCNPGQVCCYSDLGISDHCAAAGQCGIGEHQLACNGPDDCNGGICCGKHSSNTWQYSVCKPTCEGGETVFCAGAPMTCPPNQTCKPNSDLGTGYFTCAGP
jgi:hypothetical protein